VSCEYTYDTFVNIPVAAVALETLDDGHRSSVAMNRHLRRLGRVVRSVAYVVRSGYLHTSERCCPAFPDEIFENHFRVYRFVSQFCRNQRVLDVGCGTGYGSAYLANVARSVIGIDLSRQAIRYARRHYSTANLQFLQMNAESLTFPDGSFDFIISSENFEHLSDQEANLREMSRVLTDDGTVVIGTPNAEMFVGLPNRYHTHEFTYDELKRTLRTFFMDYEIAETLLPPPSKEGQLMQSSRKRRGDYGLDLSQSRSLWGREVDTTWLSNTHSFVCFARGPKRERSDSSSEALNSNSYTASVHRPSS